MINFIYALNAIVSSWHFLDGLTFCPLLLRSVVMSLKQSLSSSYRHKYLVFLFILNRPPLENPKLKNETENSLSSEGMSER